MIKVSVRQAKAHLSRYLNRLKKGEKVIICKRNVPIAELTRIDPESTKPRPFGLGKGLIKINPSFWDPLPDDELRLWEGLPPE